MTRLGPLLAATAALAVALTACGPDNDPGPNYSSVTPTPSSSSTSPTPTESTSPTGVNTSNVPSGAVAPSQAPAAQEDNSDGAFAFVAFYWKQVDWAYSTVDGDVLTGLFQESCKSCESSRSSINEVKGKSHGFRGGHLTIKSQKAANADADPNAKYAIDTTLAVEALTEVDADGSEVSTYPAATYTVRAFVAWVADHFEITATSNVGGG